MTEGRSAHRARGDRAAPLAARRWAWAVWLALAAACSPQADEAAAPAPAGEPPIGADVIEDIERGVPGGSLVMGMAGEPKTFNPLLSTDVLSTAVSDLLFARLFDYDRHAQEFVPAVAERWEYDEEAMAWIFHLREGAKWSDGTPLTSDDFLFAAEAIFDPASGSHYRELLEVEGKPFTFEAPDARTFVARIPAVDSTAFIQLINVQALPRHRHGDTLAKGTFAETLHLDTPADQIVTSGPFVLKAYRPGDRLIFAPNPHYFRFDAWGERLPYLDEYVLLSVPSFDAMALRFQAGDLDLLEDPIQPQNLKTLQDGEERGGYRLHNPGLALRNTHYWFNLKPGGTYAGEGGRRVAWEPDDPSAEPPADILERDFRYYVDPVKRSWFENVEFRRACSMATNREAMARTVFYGQAVPLYGFESAANAQWNNADIPQVSVRSGEGGGAARPDGIRRPQRRRHPSGPAGAGGPVHADHEPGEPGARADGRAADGGLQEDRLRRFAATVGLQQHHHADSGQLRL
jgi:peptide/nickel transport system substrate-binding protein